MIVVVPVAPPRDGLVLASLAEQTPLSEREARRLYEATTADVLRAIAASGGELLVNYRDAETLPVGFDGGDPEAEVRAIAEDALTAETLSDVRFERQVGSTRSARVGNTVTHLLEWEGTASVGVLEPTAPLVGRTEIDGAAMSIRRHDVVLGPSSGGRTYFSAFSESIDFEDAYEVPELSTLATRAADAGLQSGFAPMFPTVDTEQGLCATVAMLEAQTAANRVNALDTAEVVGELGLEVGEDERLERR
ncbi:hypothetical protein [Halostagnicola bangensis]